MTRRTAIRAIVSVEDGNVTTLPLDARTDEQRKATQGYAVYIVDDDGLQHHVEDYDFLQDARTVATELVRQNETDPDQLK